MAVQAVDENGVIRGKLIYPFLNGQFAAPIFVIPVAARNPIARLQRSGKISDALNKNFRSGRVAQLNGRKAKASGKKMNMAVDKTRRYELPSGVNYLRQLELAYRAPTGRSNENPSHRVLPEAKL